MCGLPISVFQMCMYEGLTNKFLHPGSRLAHEIQTHCGTTSLSSPMCCSLDLAWNRACSLVHPNSSSDKTTRRLRTLFENKKSSSLTYRKGRQTSKQESPDNRNTRWDCNHLLLLQSVHAHLLVLCVRSKLITVLLNYCNSCSCFVRWICWWDCIVTETTATSASGRKFPTSLSPKHTTLHMIWLLFVTQYLNSVW